MHIHSHTALPPSPYPSPPLPSPSESPSPPPSDDGNMSSKGTANIDGVGTLTYQRAIDIARNTEGELNPTVNAYLEGAISHIWTLINEHSASYVLSKDEFAVFNYYIRRFEGSPVAQQAVDRYWRTASEQPSMRR